MLFTCALHVRAGMPSLGVVEKLRGFPDGATLTVSFLYPPPQTSLSEGLRVVSAFVCAVFNAVVKTVEVLVSQ
jgi:hypothetical protein